MHKHVHSLYCVGEHMCGHVHEHVCAIVRMCENVCTYRDEGTKITELFLMKGNLSISVRLSVLKEMGPMFYHPWNFPWGEGVWNVHLGVLIQEPRASHQTHCEGLHRGVEMESFASSCILLR